LTRIVFDKQSDLVGYSVSSSTTTQKLDGYDNVVSVIAGLNPVLSAYNNFLFVADGTYADLAAARTALAGTQILYELATPIETEVLTVGSLLGHSKGTVYVEDVLSDYDLYSTNVTTDKAISSLSEIVKFDSEGLQTKLDIADATIAGDGLSFTHTDLSEGDFVWFSYYYTNDNIFSNTTITYYNSDFVVIDSVDSKVYRWTVAVADGVASLELTEVV
jgi:hypothetical protein